jgi:hypothetical protein
MEFDLAGGPRRIQSAMAFATGCAEWRSTAAARAAVPGGPMTSTTAISPDESVPVLSSTTMSMRGDFSNRSALLTMMPRRSAVPTAVAAVNGIARPKVQGQETIRVARLASSAFSGDAPAIEEAEADQCGKHHHHRHEAARQPVDASLHAAAGALHVPQQARQIDHAAFHPLADFDFQVAFEQDAAAQGAFADAARRGKGFPGHQRLVDRALPGDDLAIHRNRLARAHEDPVAGDQSVESAHQVAAFAQHAGPVGPGAQDAGQLLGGLESRVAFEVAADGDHGDQGAGDLEIQVKRIAKQLDVL